MKVLKINYIMAVLAVILLVPGLSFGKTKVNWGTYFGGTATEYQKSNRNTTDKDGNVYIVSTTSSTSNIATKGAYQSTLGGSSDGFVAKYNSSGKLLWATYIGGSGEDCAIGVQTDTDGNVYVGGRTQSTSGIATKGAHQTTHSGSNDCFLTSFDSTGTIRWSTYYGGSANDGINSVTVDKYNDIVVAGSAASTKGIATKGAFRSTPLGSSDLLVAKFSSSGQLIWGSFYGGNEEGETVYSVRTDSSANIYFTGWTNSSSGITTKGAYKTSYSGNEDVFLYKLNDSGAVQWATYYGEGGEDDGNEIRFDKNQNVYLVGATGSNSGIATKSAYQNTYGGTRDAFVVKFTPNGARVWGTYLGGQSADEAWGACFDANQNLVITGFTGSASGISVHGVFNTKLSGSNDIFISSFDTTGKLNWSGYYGGAGDDISMSVEKGKYNTLYLSGMSSSTSSIATKGGQQTTNNGNYDALVVSFEDSCINPIANAGGNKIICEGNSTAIGSSAVIGMNYSWASNPSGYTSSSSNPTLSPSRTTTYYLTVTNSLTGCMNNDTIDIKVNPKPVVNAGSDKTICLGSTESIGSTGVKGMKYKWLSKPSGFSDSTANPSVKPTVTTTYYLGVMNTSTGCTAYDSVNITVNPTPTALAGTDKKVCLGNSTPIGAAVTSGLKYYWISIPSGFRDTSSSNPRVSPTTTSTYVLRVTNSSGCIDYDTVKVTVLPKPNHQNIFDYTQNQDTTICNSDNGDIGFKLFNNYKYDWSNGGKGNIISVSPNSSTYYSVTITDTTTGCSVKDSIKVLVTNCKLVWQGNTDNDWNKKSNWVTVYPLHSKYKSVLDLRIPNSSDSVYIAPKSNMPLINSFTGYGNHLILKKNASLTINTTGTVTSTLQLNGNIISEDSVKINTSIGSIVKMAGVSKQFINNNSVLNIHGLDINNPLGVEMNGLINIWEVINPVSGTLTTNDKLTLKSDINATARISAINSGSDIKGKVNVERYIPSGKTNTFFLSSPVKGVVVNDWTDDFSIKANTTVMWVDEIRHTATAMKYFGAGLTDSLSAGKGWKVSIAKRPLTADLKGEINKGNIVLNTTYTPVATNVRRNGINIVGNPYPSPIDWNSSTGWTKTNIENTIYVYNSAIANWGVCSPTGNTNGATSFISSGQSFMVKATGTSPLLAVSELVKSATASTILNKNSNDYELSIKINDTLGNGDEMKVTFRDDSVTVGYDDGFDADKMDGDFINISSFDDSMNNLSLNFLPKDLFDTHTNNNPYLVDLRTTIDQASDTINFTFGNIMSFDSSIKVFLIDNKTKREIDLWKNASYKAIVENTDTSRFTLKFFKNLTGVEGNNVQTTNDIKIYPNPSHNGSFSLRGLNESAVNVVISDMNGKELFAQKIASSSNSHLINTGLPQGIYVISIHTTNGVIHKKWSVE